MKNECFSGVTYRTSKWKLRSPIYNLTFRIVPIIFIFDPSGPVKSSESPLSFKNSELSPQSSTNLLVMKEFAAPSSFNAVIKLFPITISMKK